MSEVIIHTVWIPPLYRDLTNGQEQVEMSASSIGQLIRALDDRFPGIEERLCEGNQIRSHIAVSIDGEVMPQGLRQKLRQSSEIRFAPTMADG